MLISLKPLADSSRGVPTQHPDRPSPRPTRIFRGGVRTHQRDRALSRPTPTPKRNRAGAPTMEPRLEVHYSLHDCGRRFSLG